MRSRYSAYVLGLIDYLIETTLPAQQAGLDRAAISAWSAQSTWEACLSTPGSSLWPAGTMRRVTMPTVSARRLFNSRGAGISWIRPCP